MSNEFTCDDCVHAREVKDEEIAYGTHWCKVKKEYIQCYINCDDWDEKSPAKVKISIYNKNYYKKHKERLLEIANRRLAVHPNLNKEYYRKNKKPSKIDVYMKGRDYDSSVKDANAEEEQDWMDDYHKDSKDEPDHDLEYHDKKLEGR